MVMLFAQIVDDFFVTLGSERKRDIKNRVIRKKELYVCIPKSEVLLSVNEVLSDFIQYCHCYNITLCCIEKLTNFKDRQFRAKCCTNDRKNDKLNDKETNFWQIRFSPNGVFLALYIYASTI